MRTAAADPGRTATHPAPGIEHSRGLGAGSDRGGAPHASQIRPRRANALVVAARALVLLSALALAVFGFTVTRSDGAPSATPSQYVCPMHSEVTSKAPGQCTICRMALELDRSQRSTGAARYGCPMHPEVTADQPGDCSICRMALEAVPASREVQASERHPKPDEHSGAEAFSVHGSTFGRSQLAVARPMRRAVIRGVTSPAWLDAEDSVVGLLPHEDIAALQTGERGTFFATRAPSVPYEISLLDETPERWDEATSQVRFRIELRSELPPGASAETLKLAVNEHGWVELASRRRELLMLPSSAVLRSPRGAYVLVAEASNTFVKRSVEVGRVSAGHVPILSGLAEEEGVVVGNAFFLDAERRAQAEREHAFEEGR